MKYVNARIALYKSDIEETAVVEAKLACDGVKLLIKTDNTHFSIPCQELERSTVDNVPVSLDYAEHGAVFQWFSHGQECQMIIETDSTPLRQLLQSVCAANVNGRKIRIKQRVTPLATNTESKSKTISATTSVSLDATAGVLTFDDDNFIPVSPRLVIGISAGSVSDGAGIQVAMVKPNKTVITRIILDTSRVCQLVRDYIVGDYTLSGIGGSISVLLIDDEPPATELAKIQLKQHHERLSVETATSIKAATRLLNNNSFDCVVSDYHIPGETIRSLTPIMEDINNSLSFIVFSRKAREGVPPENRPEGIDEWVQKEIGTEQYRRLGVLIKQLVARRRQGSSEVTPQLDPTVLNNTTRTFDTSRSM